MNAVPKGDKEDIHYMTEDPKTSDVTLYKGRGCEACQRTGYRGMIGVFEIVQFTQDLREAIINNLSVTEIEDLATTKDFQSMALDALQKVKSGIIHFDDIYHILLEKIR